MDINSITVSGTVSRAPQAKTTTTGKTFSRFSISVEKSFGGKTFYLDVDVWGKMCETIGSVALQGAKVIVTGRLDVSSYTDQQTQQRKMFTSVTADNVVSLAQLQISAPAQCQQNQHGGGYGGYGAQTSVPQSQYQQQYRPQQNTWSGAQGVAANAAPATPSANAPSDAPADPTAPIPF